MDRRMGRDPSGAVKPPCGLSIDVLAIAKIDDHDHQPFVVDVADQAIITHPIAPGRGMLAPKRFAAETWLA